MNRPKRVKPVLLTVASLLGLHATVTHAAEIAEKGALFRQTITQAQPSCTYYLATTGDDSHPGTIDQPWATLQKAHDVLEPGDTLRIRGGIYAKQPGVLWTKSGQSGKPITIMAYPGEEPVFDGTNYAGALLDRSTPEETLLFYVIGADYLIFEGLRIHTYFDGFNIKAHPPDEATHIVIRNCHIHSTTSHNIYLVQNVEDVEIYSCVVRDSGRELKVDYVIHGWHDPGVLRAKIHNNVFVDTQGGILFADGARDIEIYNSAFLWSYLSGLGGTTRDGEWQELALPFIVPEGVAFVSCQAFKGDNTKPGGQVWADDSYLGEGLGLKQPASPKKPFNGTHVRVDHLGNFDVKKNGIWTPFSPLCMYSDNCRDSSVYSKQGWNTIIWTGAAHQVKQAREAKSEFNPDGMLAGFSISQYTFPSGGEGRLRGLAHPRPPRINDFEHACG